MKPKFILFFSILLSLFHNVSSQDSNKKYNTITTAVPFLTICPDARSASMGLSGVATSPDIYSQNQNPAKYAFFYPKKSFTQEWNYKFLYKQDTCTINNDFDSFVEKIQDNNNQPNFNCIDSCVVYDRFSVAFNYLPWVHRKLSDGIYMGNLFVFGRINRTQTISGSFRYSSFGKIYFYDNLGIQTGQANPIEYAIDISYSRLLAKKLSGALTFRYIYSDLTPGLEGTYGASSVSADLSLFYFQKIRKSTFSSGLYISNIGEKISYDKGETHNFIPTNLRLGIGYSSIIDKNNEFGIYLNASKLLVKTPNPAIPNEEYDNTSIFNAISQSFTDAPGGLKEELQEIAVSIGVENTINQNFFIRGGFFYENKYKGGRNFLTTGIGANIFIENKILTIDGAYNISTNKTELGNQIQLSASFTL